MAKSHSESWRQGLATRLRTARGLTMSQSQLAAKSGVSDRTISTIEQGGTSHRPKPETVARLAIATGSDPAEWLALMGQQIAEEKIEELRKIIEGSDTHELVKDLKQDIRQEMDSKYKPYDEVTQELRQKYRPYEVIRAEVQDLIAKQQLTDEAKEILLSDVMKKFEGYEPASQIKAYVNDRVSDMETRISQLRNLMGDITARVDHLAAFCSDLSRQEPKKGGR